MAIIVGLTGGIGSGKTTVGAFFNTLGVPVYIADDEARKIMDDKNVLHSIKEQFGEIIFDGEQLNREKLAQIVFKNPEKLKVLNGIIHPLVKNHFDNWVLQNKQFPFVIKEAAILFESGSYKDCDFVITVTAPMESRIERVINRDKTTREAVLMRISNQWTDEEKIAKSDFVIKNTSIGEMEKQVKNIVNLLKNS